MRASSVIGSLRALFLAPALALALALATALSLWPALAPAATYPLPAEADSVIGELQYVTARYEDTLFEIGRRYGVGYEEMVAANRDVDYWLPGEGTRVAIPSLYVLPDAPHTGVVINLAEHRLYYFPPVKAGERPIVKTYPVSVGKMDWTTPLGVTQIVHKRTRPIWYPPESVRREHAAEGRPLPRAVPPGPDNPLGSHAMRLGIPGGAYLIHGTNRPSGVGMQVTHGCIRMFPEDIEEFYELVPVGTPVRIVHQPAKMGWRGEELFIEVHPPLEGDLAQEGHTLTNVTRVLVSATQDRTVPIDWARAERAFEKATGIPEPVVLGVDPEQLVDAGAGAHE